MIHEAIAALLGCGGNFFADEVRGQASVLDFHPGEIQLLNRIHSLGLKYKSLKDFASNNLYQWASVSSTHEGGERRLQPAWGTYVHALRDGLSDQLRSYVRDVSVLEDVALRDPHFTVCDLLSHVHKYSPVFHALVSLTQEVSEQKMHGIHLLTYLNRRLSTCVGEERVCVECLLHSCHRVLLKHLTSWLLYGYLEDGPDDFFIQRRECPDMAGMEGETTGSTTVAGGVSTGCSGSGPVLAPDSSDTTSASRPAKSECDMFHYEVRLERLPSYVMPSLAYKILFIGETVMMFSGSEEQHKACRKQSNKSVSCAVEHVSSVGGAHAVWADRELEFLSRLRHLQHAHPLNMVLLEQVVHDVGTCLTQHLWKLAVEKAEMFTQFRLFKDFFLLGRGELFLEFIQLASGILNKAPTNKSEREVNSAFQIAARKVLMNDESAMDKFKLHLPVPGSSAQNEDFVMGWNVVGLTYKVTWPLHFIFTAAVVRNYNELFRFLLRVKKVQAELHNSWVKHLQSRMRCKPEVWQLHRNLMFMVDNLQYYLQVDVLESQYTLLQAKINDTKDFDVVKVAHSQFQTNILSQAFLLMEHGAASQSSEGTLRNNSVHKCLCLFLELCEEFCCSVHQRSLYDAPEQMDGMVQRCNWLIRLLLEMLAGLRTHPCGTYLSQLLLRLNYNHWFHKKANLSVSAADSTLASSFADTLG